MDHLQMYFPWKSNLHFLQVGLRTTIILVGIYHHPKGTAIFKMVVDFQGFLLKHGGYSIAMWVLKKDRWFFDPPFLVENGNRSPSTKFPAPLVQQAIETH